MVDKVEVTVTDLSKKHNGKPDYKGFYSFAKHPYQDDGEIVNEGFALGKEALEALRAKIKAVLIDDLSIKENKSNTKTNNQEKTKQTKLL